MVVLNHYFTPFDGRRLYDRHGDRFCCHNNLRRFFGDLPGWVYYRTKDGVLVNLYSDSTAKIDLGNGVEVVLRQQTVYPTSGSVLLTGDTVAGGSNLISNSAFRDGANRRPSR